MTKNITKILEKNGFDVNVYDNYYEINQYTPAGEDWFITLNDLNDIVEYAENFDPEEEFTMWMEARQRGTRGVPGPAELWQDQLWKQKLLNKIANKITK